MDGQAFLDMFYIPKIQGNWPKYSCDTTSDRGPYFGVEGSLGPSAVTWPPSLKSAAVGTGRQIRNDKENMSAKCAHQ